MAFSPLQTSFAGGELSPRVAGRRDSDVYRRGLSVDSNFEVLPQGGLRMRGGSQFIADLGISYSPRLVPFRVAGSADDYCVTLLDGALAVYSATTGAAVAIKQNLITNGHFDSSITGWSTVAGTVSYNAAFEALEMFFVGPATLGRTKQTITTTLGETYVLSFKAWIPPAGGGSHIHTYVDGVVEAHSGLWFAKKTCTRTFVAAGATTDIEFENGSLSGSNLIDDVVVYHQTNTVASLTGPWTDDQLAAVQFSPEPTKNRIVLVHPAVAPQVVTYTAPDVWEVYTAEFVAAPGQWATGNYPSCVEAGFQGRLWFAATPNEPSTVWYSKSGASFDFTTGVDPDDSSSFIVSTKGTLRWMQGQKALLAGDDVFEHSLQGSSQIIAPGDIDVRDESAFGSAAIQAIHIGDQVLYVTRDGRHIRALSYSKDENAWLSRAITFLAEHVTEGGIKEIHFARNPYPCIFAVLQDGLSQVFLVACTYDRGEQVVAFWRMDCRDIPVVAARLFTAACVLDTEDGAEVWVALRKTGGDRYLERIPLYETGRQYLDSWVTATKTNASELTGLTHLNGGTVSVLMDGTLMASSYVVNGGKVTSAGLFTGTTFIVGVPITARAVTMPLQAGNPKGSAHNAKRRFAKIAAIVNDCDALPLVNGVRLNNKGEAASYTGVYDAAPPGGWETEGAITITQDQPARTEVLAIGGVASASEV